MTSNGIDVAAMRKSYESGTLTESLASSNPFDQFTLWFNEAKATLSDTTEVNACALATVDPTTLRPSNRILLLKEYDSTGFVFYTNLESRKGRELAADPFAAMTFWWQERSVRIEGSIVRVPDAQADLYFASRPRGSQIGAWVSAPQSGIVPNREFLECRAVELEIKFKGVDIPRPEFWGGFRLVPDRIEFWQGRQSRIHDRLVYISDKGGWDRCRLSP